MSIINNVLTSKYQLSLPKSESVSDLVFSHLLINSEKVLIIDSQSGSLLSGQQIHEVCTQIANAFVNEYQLKRGDIVCSICSNTYIQTIGFLSVLAAGGVCVFVDELATYDEIQKILQNLNFKYLICEEENQKIASQLAANYSQIKNVFVVAQEDHELSSNCINFDKLLNYKITNLNAIPVKTDPIDMALIELTNGYDGERKAVIKTHLNLINSIHQLKHSDILANEEEDILISIPLTRIFGVSLFLNSLISGSKMVLIPGNLERDSNRFMESIEKFKVTKLLLFTSDIIYMINHEGNLIYNISSIKEIFSIGVFGDYNRIRTQVESMFKCRYFRAAYGTVETGIVSCIYKSKSFERNCYSVGQLVPGTQLKVIDIKSGLPLSVYQTGEVCVKSNQISPGYLTLPSGESKPNSIFTKDGFFKTSDAGYYDCDGYLYIECKLSDMIAIEDQIFSPKEMEILLLSHPDVIEATVIGMVCSEEYEDQEEEDDDEEEDSNITINNNNNKTNESFNNNISNTFKAFVVLRAGSDTNDLDLINYVNDRVEPIKQLDSGISIVDVLPRNPMGIINKTSLIKY